jgi:hypothetical protein
MAAFHRHDPIPLETREEPLGLTKDAKFPADFKYGLSRFGEFSGLRKWVTAGAGFVLLAPCPKCSPRLSNRSHIAMGRFPKRTRRVLALSPGCSG